MQSQAFIFSNQPKYRIARHAAFWIFWWLFQGFLYAFTPGPHKLGLLGRLPLTMLDSLLFMTDHIFLSYSLMYFVLPVYLLKNKYFAASIWIVILFLATGAMASVISLYVINSVRIWLLPAIYGNYIMPHRDSFFIALLAGLRGGITIGGLATSIKLMKHWYVKQQRILQLQKENMEAQLQVLKAQVHPHFLFNTLNNIYSYTQNTSAVASQLVMGLSDMLRYMLYEGSQPLVPLSKELKMIEEYIGLEKIRYGNKLELHIDMPAYTHDLNIAPLMLLPFAENCFKHGTSNILENPWLNLQITLKDNMMAMKLLNGKPPQADGSNRKPGIGIGNVRKRLELIYPGKHLLTITNDPDVFIVSLKVELEKKQLLSEESVHKLEHHHV
ncbi:MAG TPA: histidine kinase [Puia sp.]|nr:histidine kinase [Puia sp.]